MTTSDQSPRNSRTGPALLLIGLGIFFLLAQVINLGSIMSVGWPFFVILPGLAFLYTAFNGGKKAAGFAVPGSVITGTGLLLLFQNLTGHWESWAYAWTLYSLFVGLAINFIGERTGKDDARRVGQGLVRGGGIAFLILGTIFELLIFRSGGALSAVGVPLLMMGLGVYLLGGRKRSEPAKRKFIPARLSEDELESDMEKRKQETGVPMSGKRLEQAIDAALKEE
jgi:hypothetical protein